jgi:capsular exopolysaccharide synthesis family protein
LNQSLPSDSFQPHFIPGGHFAAEPHAQAAGSQFDLRYVLSAVRANLWLILGIVGAALVLALGYTLLKTPRYTAAATVQINDSSGRILGNQEEPGDEQASGWYDTERFLKTQTDIIKSRGLAQRVAQRLKLTGNARFYTTQEAAPPAAALPAEVKRDQVIGLLRGNLTVDLPRDSRIVSIRFESTDPDYSAEIANAYAAEFIQSNLQRRFDSSAYARSFLSEQLETARRKLEESERSLNAYARDNGLIRTGGRSGDDKSGDGESGGSVTTSSLMQVNSAANEATARRIEAEGRWRAISGGPLLSAPQVVANQTVSMLLAEKSRVAAALAEEQSRRLDDYPSVKAKQEELASIERQIQQAAISVRNAVRAEYQSALAVERQLGAQVNQLKGETLAEQDRTVQYGLLAREVDTNRQVYDGLLERFKTLNAIAGVSLSNIYVIDSASAPGGPSSPNLLKNLALGLIVGLGLAGLTVVLRDQFDDSIRVPEDVEPKLGLALLGVIPKSQEDAPAGELTDPKSPISEAYNSLRGSLLYSTPTGLPRILLVTSAQPGEGKTTSSSAIAAGFARMGKRTVLLDADMRRPSLHRQFGLPNEQGLSTLLTSSRPLAELALPSGQDNLSLVLAGPVPPSPTELLSTTRIEEVLREAAKAFDVVVIDSPPVLGLADSPLMGGLVDGVVFVVEADRSRRGSLKASLRRLRAMRPLILGAVLTKFDPLKSGNRYSEYYGYDYYQYDSGARARA